MPREDLDNSDVPIRTYTDSEGEFDLNKANYTATPLKRNRTRLSSNKKVSFDASELESREVVKSLKVTGIDQHI